MKPNTPRVAPDPVMTNRASSSLAILATRVAEVVAAHRAQDEAALRAELRALSEEAGLLAGLHPLLSRPMDNG
jgi:hypothetical protein